MRKMFVSGVGHRLSTTGLVHWINDLAPKFLKQLQRGNSYLGIELVNVTGDK